MPANPWVVTAGDPHDMVMNCCARRNEMWNVMVIRMLTVSVANSPILLLILQSHLCRVTVYYLHFFFVEGMFKLLRTTKITIVVGSDSLCEYQLSWGTAALADPFSLLISTSLSLSSNSDCWRPVTIVSISKSSYSSALACCFRLIGLTPSGLKLCASSHVLLWTLLTTQFNLVVALSGLHWTLSLLLVNIFVSLLTHRWNSYTAAS